jgi:hypothetical protein
MKKKYLVGTVLGLGLIGGGYLLGGHVGAASDWQSTVFNNANSEIGTAGYNKTQDLTSDPNTISDSMQKAMEPEIQQQQAELEKELVDYYNMKLQGLTNTDTYKQLEQKISDLKESIAARYKAQIDQEFATTK